MCQFSIHVLGQRLTCYIGDERVLKGQTVSHEQLHLSLTLSFLAFRLKMRADALEAVSKTTPHAYQETIQLGYDIAEVLRRNVVQAQKVREQTESNKETWRALNPVFYLFIPILKFSWLFTGLRLTKDTEMGDNESIKTAQPCTSNSRRARKEEKEAQGCVFLSVSSGHAEGNSEPDTD